MNTVIKKQIEEGKDKLRNFFKDEDYKEFYSDKAIDIIFSNAYYKADKLFNGFFKDNLTKKIDNVDCSKSMISELEEKISNFLYLYYSNENYYIEEIDLLKNKLIIERDRVKKELKLTKSIKKVGEKTGANESAATLLDEASVIISHPFDYIETLDSRNKIYELYATIDPYEIMMCSEKSTYTSCFSWGGQHGFSPNSYARSENVVMFYILNDTNEKIFRQFIIVSDNQINVLAAYKDPLIISNYNINKIKDVIIKQSFAYFLSTNIYEYQAGNFYKLESEDSSKGNKVLNNIIGKSNVYVDYMSVYITNEKGFSQSIYLPDLIDTNGKVTNKNHLYDDICIHCGGLLEDGNCNNCFNDDEDLFEHAALERALDRYEYYLDNIEY